MRGRLVIAATFLGLGCVAHSDPKPAAHPMFVDGLSPTAMGGISPSAATGMPGTWLYTTGTATRTCPGESGWDAPPQGALVVNPGNNPSELVVVEPGACSLRFSRAGDVATIAPDQTCAGPDGSGGTITFSKMTWTLTLAPDGRTMTEALSADEKLSPTNAPARTCTFTERGVTLRRER